MERIYSVMDVSRATDFAVTTIRDYEKNKKLPAYDYEQGLLSFWSEIHYREALEILSKKRKWCRDA